MLRKFVPWNGGCGVGLGNCSGQHPPEADKELMRINSNCWPWLGAQFCRGRRLLFILTESEIPPSLNFASVWHHSLIPVWVMELLLSSWDKPPLHVYHVICSLASLDMQVECSELQLKSELQNCIVLSCVTQKFCLFWEVFAQAGFILGCLLQGLIVEDARKSVALCKKQKEKENCLVCRAQTALLSLVKERKSLPQLWLFPILSITMFFFGNGLVLPKDNFSILSDIKKNEFCVFKKFHVLLLIICLAFRLCLLEGNRVVSSAISFYVSLPWAILVFIHICGVPKFHACWIVTLLNLLSRAAQISYCFITRCC